MRATAMTDMKAMKFQITEGKNNQWFKNADAINYMIAYQLLKREVHSMCWKKITENRINMLLMSI